MLVLKMARLSYSAPSWSRYMTISLIFVSLGFSLFLYVCFLSQTQLMKPKPIKVIKVATVTDRPWSPPDPINCEFNGLNTSTVFNGTFSLDDQKEALKLEKFIRKCRMIPPSNKPYNLTDPNGDPSAQQGVRKYVQDVLLGGMRNGTFLEFGANDGEFLSNTLVLERDHGWTGLLIEADPEAVATLLTKKRKAWAFSGCAGIHKYPYKSKMYRHRTWGPSVSMIEGSILKRGSEWIHEFEVECIPLYPLMKAVNLTTLDYVSMDIEGVELDVLKNIPFDKVSVKVFSIETNDKVSVIEFMSSKGYKFMRAIQGAYVNDVIFIHANYGK